MVPGVKINLAGRVYIVPALNTGGMRATREARKILAAMDPSASDISDDQLDALHLFVHASLKRNYPDLELEDMGDLVDLHNMPLLIGAITGQSGLVEALPGEGEPQAEANPKRSPTGAGSTR